MIISGIVFIFGLVIGSFLNVVIDRLPRGENIVWKPSHCDHCKKPLRWYELIPVISFLFLGGKCARCKKRLSYQYPLIELVSGISFVLLYSQAADSVGLISLIFLFCLFLVLFVIDLKEQILPDELLISLLFFCIIYVIRLPQADRIIHLMSGLGAGSGFLFLWLVTRGRGLGFGDVKLSVLLGALLGYPNIIIALYAAFLTGALVGVILIMSRKAKMRSRIAFGPFLILGTLIAFRWGGSLWEIWLRLLV
ncbi:prepilin peptidase [Candidatus Gottesmanbacteria bacterium]|nr:prepilin peptidase [Candidatus Gottesmanbacteria bacterium]